jgi:phospholipid/cholesterol/gamma-HCH transport system ATP-binding protein
MERTPISIHQPAPEVPRPEGLTVGEARTIPASVPAVELLDVEKRFGELEVLRGVRLSVAQSETCVLFGVSGSGKTVLLKLVAGLYWPDAGEVRVLGEDLASLHGKQLLRERRNVGVLFQAGALFDSMTVAQNVAFPIEERRQFNKREIARRVQEVLAQVGLADCGRLFPAELSGGMVKRVALARALVFDPPVLVFDEPTAGLDPLTTRTVIELIGRAGREGRARRSVLAVVNDLAAAFAIADKLALLHEGRIVAHGTPDAFRASPHPAVQRFLSAWNRRDALARGAPA